MPPSSSVIPLVASKEQTSGLHARKLAELGYVALAFDASYYGESGGYPRRMESPEVRVEDFSAAVDFLTNHPAVYADKIGVIGICGGGCYSVSATQIDHRIKALGHHQYVRHGPRPPSGCRRLADLRTAYGYP